jgi:hypothetical protein
VLNAGEALVSLDGICLFALFRFLLKAELASLISLKIEALFEKMILISATVVAEFVAAEFASNLLTPATIRLRSACKSIVPNAGVVENEINPTTMVIEISFHFM